MDKITKALQRLSNKERKAVAVILEQLIARDFSHLNVKKLKGYEDVFRVRKGDVRILFKLQRDVVRLIAIDRRKEDTYKF
ncbi:MAG: hypothetical protein AAB439_04105 [Patescibacteria group bacterium]